MTFRPRLACSTFVALIILSTACSRDTPIGPTPGEPVTLVAFTISPSVSTFLIGHPARLTAQAAYSDGSTRIVAAQWSAAPVEIATVDSTGTLTLLKTGTTAITASFDGRTATKSLRVLPDYGGTWDGSAQVVACTSRLQESCPTWDTGVRRISLWVDQTEDRIHAFLYISQDRELFVDGSVATDGAMILSGERVEPDFSGPYVAIRIGEWRTTIDPAGALTGGFTSWMPEYPDPDRNNPSVRRRYVLTNVQRTFAGRLSSP
jgi:hypothetical protein